MVNERKITAADMALLLGVSAAISVVLAGCGATTGWKIEMGVHPISAVHDVEALNKKELDNGRFETLAR